MRVIILVLLSFTLMAAVLVGCQSEQNSQSKSEKNKLGLQEKVKEDEIGKDNEHESDKLILEDEILMITISKARGGNQIVFDEVSAIQSFRSIISSAVKLEAIVNMADPMYDLDVIYADERKQSFHL